MIEVRDPVALYNKTKFSVDEYLAFEKILPKNMNSIKVKSLPCPEPVHDIM